MNYVFRTENTVLPTVKEVVVVDGLSHLCSLHSPIRYIKKGPFSSWWDNEEICVYGDDVVELNVSNGHQYAITESGKAYSATEQDTILLDQRKKEFEGGFKNDRIRYITCSATKVDGYIADFLDDVFRTHTPHTVYFAKDLAISNFVLNHGRNTYIFPRKINNTDYLEICQNVIDQYGRSWFDHHMDVTNATHCIILNGCLIIATKTEIISSIDLRSQFNRKTEELHKLTDDDLARIKEAVEEEIELEKFHAKREETAFKKMMKKTIREEFSRQMDKHHEDLERIKKRYEVDLFD
jgi:hypothetical protein